MLVATVLLLASQGPPAVVYVDDTATGANDGTSWHDAFTDLQNALEVASPPTQVWVAEGRYKPTPGLNRSECFRPRTAVFGGFAGHEATLEERAGLFERTILTGDLLGDDGPDFVNYDDNSVNVVQFAWSTGPLDIQLDGFKITAANAEGGYGGGTLAVGVDAFELRRTLFVANRGSNGGGLGFLFALGRVEDCTFVGNHSEVGGGGLNVDIGSAPLIERCWFLGNHARFVGGGGAYTISPTTFVDCVFSGNFTSGSHGGGGLFSPALSSLVIGCTISMNSAVGSGLGAGGLLCASKPGCVQLNVLDTILWGNLDDSGSGQDAQVRAYVSSSPPVLVSCCVQGWVAMGCSQDVFAADPLFLDADGPDGIAGTTDDLLELGEGSPCIDVGRHFRAIPQLFFEVGAPLLDAAGKRRYVDLLLPGDGHVLDLGALERPAGR